MAEYPKRSDYLLEDMIDLAKDVCGSTLHPYGKGSSYSRIQWLEASILALETRDISDLSYMCWREDMWEHFLEWINKDLRNRDGVDFNEWLDEVF